LLAGEVTRWWIAPALSIRWVVTGAALLGFLGHWSWLKEWRLATRVLVDPVLYGAVGSLFLCWTVLLLLLFPFVAFRRGGREWWKDFFRRKFRRETFNDLVPLCYLLFVLPLIPVLAISAILRRWCERRIRPETASEAVEQLGAVLDVEWPDWQKELREKPEVAFAGFRLAIEEMGMCSHFGLWEGNTKLLQDCGTRDDPSFALDVILNQLRERFGGE
jgi:hypothetical protein